MMANTRHSHLAACPPYLTACCVARARDLSPALNHTIVRVVTSGAHRHDVFGAPHLWSLGQGHPSRNHPGHTVYCITHVSLSSHLAGCLLAEFLLNRNSAGWLPTSSKWCGCLSPSVHSHCTLRTLLTWTSHKVARNSYAKCISSFMCRLAAVGLQSDLSRFGVVPSGEAIRLPAALRRRIAKHKTTSIHFGAAL